MKKLLESILSMSDHDPQEERPDVMINKDVIETNEMMMEAIVWVTLIALFLF